MLRQPVVQACCAPLTSEVLSAADALTLSRQFAALADPVRLQLVSLLATSDGGAVYEGSILPLRTFEAVRMRVAEVNACPT